MLTPRQIVLDTETTGLDQQKGHRVVEIGAVEINHRKIEENKTLHVYLNPDRDIPTEAVKVHGLTAQFLSQCPKFFEIAEQFIAFVRDAELIIHNASFDVGFLNHELSLAGLKPLSHYGCQITDTIAIAKKKFPGKNVSLDALCNRLGVDNSQREHHGALKDAQLLAKVYLLLTREEQSLLFTETNTDVEDTWFYEQEHEFPVIALTEEDMMAHHRFLATIMKQSGQTVWQDLLDESKNN